MIDNIQKIPYEKLLVRVFGENWRDFSSNELDGVWGVAIVQSILDGIKPNLRELGSHLGIDSNIIKNSFLRLNLNGMFLRHRIRKDHKALNKNNILAWCQYAGIASGATGNILYVERRPRK